MPIWRILHARAADYCVRQGEPPVNDCGAGCVPAPSQGQSTNRRTKMAESKSSNPSTFHSRIVGELLACFGIGAMLTFALLVFLLATTGGTR